MRQTVIEGAFATLCCALIATFGFQLEVNAAEEQSRSECQPPKASEYVLLVAAQTTQNQRLLEQILPENTNINICNYRDNIVARISGFSSLEDAEKWKRYVNEISGLPAFVAKPSAGNSAVATQSASPPKKVRADDVATAPRVSAAETEPELETRQAPGIPAFNPQLLGSGYAVLVDYSNQPEIAAKVEQLLGKNVGLVSFGKRPYLLALYTSNERNANNTFRLLNDRGFLVMLVDSKKVTLLKPEVKEF